MPFTAQEIENIFNSTLDFYMDKGKVHAQTLQDKPLFRGWKGKQKSFPGGKEFISVAVKGAYTTTIQGFTHDESVTYANPANTKRAQYPWKEIHAGIQFTGTELKKDGISIVDTTTGKSESQHSEREMTALVNILKEKYADMKEGVERGMNLMFLRDGTQDADLVPGMRSFILNDPTTATVIGGIDQQLNTWWRNYKALSLSTGTPSDQVIVQALQVGWRQMRRYAQGEWSPMVVAGADFIDAMEKELRAKGFYTETGWSRSGGIDVSMGDPEMKGVKIVYDPTLDDEGLAKYCYVIDMSRIFPMVMEGEDMKTHAPARPENKYVYYRGVTWTGGMVCTQRNTSGVFSIA